MFPLPLTSCLASGIWFLASLSELIFACIRPVPPLLYFGPMAIYALKKGDESGDRLQQRFKKQVQKSGLLKILRARSHYKKPLTRRLQRIRALKREDYRKENRKTQFYSNM